ncbi:hypothetical protein I7I50_03870 [Histoplasma capsulatum G186AR]|nr:hypothetical protein I7I52_04778 [Histoplasma capsulatum]QSS74910.1 hypothetical protein I7I50_03870 [Histoplasma capsulatum G186AR]
MDIPGSPDYSAHFKLDTSISGEDSLNLLYHLPALLRYIGGAPDVILPQDFSQESSPLLATCEIHLTRPRIRMEHAPSLYPDSTRCHA